MPTNFQYIRPFMLLSSLVFFVFTPEVQGQEDQNRQERDRRDRVREVIREHYEANEALNQDFVLDDAEGSAVEQCNDMFEVDDVGSGSHFEVGNKFLITGPIQNSGNYQVTALPPHPWKGPPKHYFAEATWQPDWFDIYGIIVQPHDGMSEREHIYSMQVTDWGPEGCPDYVFFWFKDHVPTDGTRDPGHGGAGR